jgi:acyl-CoA reductase-like NAD-dependent aldehyde dehydrogenase
MSFRTQLFINGKWADPVLGGKFTTFNPANDQPITEVANATTEDVDKAVAAAKACLYSEHWGYKSTGAQRAVVLRRLGDIITARKDELARMDSLDQGKPLREALADMVTLSLPAVTLLTWPRSRTRTRMRSSRTEPRVP